MIILEGPDGSGKSTLGRILANVFDTKVFHPGGAPDVSCLEKTSSICIEKLKAGFILDRVNQISEVVYGPIMNNRTLMTEKDALGFLDFAEIKGYITIYCRPDDIENMADNQTEEADRDTPENTAKLKKNHTAIVKAYDDIFARAKLRFKNIFWYNYKDPNSFKELLEFIENAGVGIKARPSVYEYFIEMAHLAAKRGTCCRRKVGCVLTDKNKHVLATGYNGRPRGFTHCSEGKPCSAAAAPSGVNLEGCEAIHAEQNALLQCKDTEKIHTAYVTLFPCVTCIKLLLNTSCRYIVYSEDYVQPEAVELWDRAGRFMIHQPLNKKGL